MPPWAYVVLVCVVLVAIGVVVDRSAGRTRHGLVRPADTKGRSSADPVVQARTDNPGAAGITERMEGRVGGIGGTSGMG